MNKRPVRHINSKLIIQYAILVIIGWSITTYIFLNSYEILFNHPIPFIDAVGAVQSSTLITSLIKNKIYYNYSPGFAVLEKNGIFQELRIPRINVRLNLIPAIKNGNQWIYRSNSGQYFFLSDNKTSNPNTIVIYLNKNWRSIYDPQDLILGDNIFLEKNDNTTSLFRIIDKKTLPYNTAYLPSEVDGNITLILIVEDSSQKAEYIIQADNIINTSNTTIQ